LDEITSLILLRSNGRDEPFVLFDHDRPVGTASFVRNDLATRRDLTPCLAGVFVDPAFRGRGYATALVRQVEAFASAASVPTLWLHTWTAKSLYARLGWRRVRLETDRGRQVVLMSRRLAD
jgi:GNAT superfamily N-acetyltransferase